MTDTTRTERRSHCIGCGKRLSAITAKGNIRWQPSHIDDKGLYCAACFDQKADGKKKNPQTRK